MLTMRLVAVYIFSSNVTVQGTRHLVEGTLEPIVRIFILEIKRVERQFNIAH